jgi:hypothetical protein
VACDTSGKVLSDRDFSRACAGDKRERMFEQIGDKHEEYCHCVLVPKRRASRSSTHLVVLVGIGTILEHGDTLRNARAIDGATQRLHWWRLEGVVRGEWGR